jgi:hypothetical protein
MAWFGFSLAAAALTTAFAFGGLAAGPALAVQAAAFAFLTALIDRVGRGEPEPPGASRAHNIRRPPGSKGGRLSRRPAP